MRLFVAILLTEEIKQHLMDTIAKIKPYILAGRFSHRDNLHLTLAFIGETTQISKAKQVLSEVDCSAFSIALQKGGRFRRDGGDIVWAGIEKNPKLESLAGQVQRLLREKGFQLQERSFQAHLTLGREVVMEPDFDWKMFWEQQPQCTMEVEKVSLMKSERINGKLTYTEISVVELNNNSLLK